jgi:hypothetical protein
MAQKVTVAVEDDLDGGSTDETVRFGFEGTDFEIDLSAKNARAFRRSSRRSSSTPARRAAGRLGGRRGPQLPGSAAERSGRGPATTASR